MIIQRKSPPLYWVSENLGLDQECINPSIPRNFLVQDKAIDWKTRRVQLFDNLSDAISIYGIGKKNLEGAVLGVYRPKFIRKENKLDPGIENSPYSFALSGKEYWCLNPIDVVKIADIRIGKRVEEKSFRYGGKSLMTSFTKKNSLSVYSWEEILPDWDKKGKTRKLPI